MCIGQHSSIEWLLSNLRLCVFFITSTSRERFYDPGIGDFRTHMETDHDIDHYVALMALMPRAEKTGLDMRLFEKTIPLDVLHTQQTAVITNMKTTFERLFAVDRTIESVAVSKKLAAIRLQIDRRKVVHEKLDVIIGSAKKVYQWLLDVPSEELEVLDYGGIDDFLEEEAAGATWTLRMDLDARISYFNDCDMGVPTSELDAFESAFESRGHEVDYAAEMGDDELLLLYSQYPLLTGPISGHAVDTG